MTFVYDMDKACRIDAVPDLPPGQAVIVLLSALAWMICLVVHQLGEVSQVQCVCIADSAWLYAHDHDAWMS